MKYLLLPVTLFLFCFSLVHAQPEDKGGGGGGLPFNGKHADIWDSFNKEKKQDIIKVHQANLNFFNDFKAAWKECFKSDEAPTNFTELYVNFMTRRQLKVLDVKEDFEYKCTNRSQRLERKALRKEKRQERCIFQGERKQHLKDFLKSPNSKIYLELRYDLQPGDPEKIIEFLQGLL